MKPYQKSRSVLLWFVLLMACVVYPAAHAATEVWVVTDETGQLLSFIPVTLFPNSIYTNGYNGFATLKGRTFNTDMTGTVAFTNLTVGGYVAGIKGGTGQADTYVGFTITNYLSTNYIVSNSTVAITSQTGLNAFTMAASDLRYLQFPDLTILSGEVPTADGLGGYSWQPQSGGGSGNFIPNTTQLVLDGGGKATIKNGATVTNLNGNLNGPASTATNFTGMLSGNVTGTQGATVVSVAPASAITGVVSPANLGSGTASSSTFLAGDQTYKAISGSSSSNYVVLSAGTQNITNTLTVSNLVATAGPNIFTNAGNGAVVIGEGAHGLNLNWNTFNLSEGGVKLTQYGGDVLWFGDNANNSTTNTGMFSLWDHADNFYPIKWTPDGLFILDGAGAGGGTLSLYGGTAPGPFLIGVAITNNLNTALNTLTAMTLKVTNSVTLPGATAANTITAIKITSTNGFVGAATSATNVTGSFAGDVTGTQGATVVASVGGQTETDISTAVGDVLTATSANNASTIVKRDSSGNFTAGTITAALTGNASTATSAGTVTGSVGGSVNLPASQLTGTVANARLNIGVAANNVLALDSGANLDLTGGGAIKVDGSGGELAVLNGATFISSTTSTENAITAMSVTSTNGFFGNGTGITNLMGNASAWTNYTASGSTTNFIINLSGPPNGVVNLSADCCITGLTNGPGSIALTINCGDGSNHKLLFPSAFHMQGNTNIISSVIGTNSAVTVTNGMVVNLVVKPVQIVTNPNATNSIIFMGESAN